MLNILRRCDVRREECWLANAPGEANRQSAERASAQPILLFGERLSVRMATSKYWQGEGPHAVQESPTTVNGSTEAGEIQQRPETGDTDVRNDQTIQDEE